MRKVVVIGGGAAGVELALAMHHRLAHATMPHAIDFAVVTDAQWLLPDHNRQTRAALERALAQRGIAVYLNSRVTRVETTQVILGGAAEAIASDATIWATGAGAPSWLADTGLTLDAQGFIRIDERLASVSNPEIFAAGDCATIEGHGTRSRAFTRCARGRYSRKICAACWPESAWPATFRSRMRWR